jgi:hypothetical protein
MGTRTGAGGAGRTAAILMAALATCCGEAWAGGDPAKGFSVGFFAGRGVTNDLRNLPYDIPAGTLDWVDSYVGEGIVRYALRTPRWMPGSAPNAWIPLTQSVEFGVYGYRGFKRNAAFSLDWRPAINFLDVGQFSFDFAYGIGIWRSLGTPWYNHPSHPEYDHQYKTLLHMTPEFVVRARNLPGWSLGFRDSHVSGAYGLIAPSTLGTNHLGVTLMKSF